ncbi:surfeit locus protein 2-like [Patiria miniata]|uniref:Surfeit locus protein 2 n=1 Tax=Patiria miniata TaxID=46514 RepID=A0A913Z5I3_PATMI|nr:surfeit locus protein 2-like [Patiria miniata]
MAAPRSSKKHEHENKAKLTDLIDDDVKEIASLPQEIHDFIKMHPSLNYIGSQKVRCTLTGHEMPCKMSAMESYTQGRRYQRLRELSHCDVEKYRPHIIPSKKKGRGHQLFCTLTLRHISREPADIERHMKGKRYTRAFAKYEESQRLGVPFKPHCRIPRKDKQGWDSNQERRKDSTTDSEASEAETDDSMSDLYPAEDFEGDPSGEAERLEDDIENMVVADAENPKGRVSDGKKRKNTDVSKQTKVKKPKQLLSKT